MHKFPRNYHHATLCRYHLADQRCHRLIMREIKDTAVVQITAVNNAHWWIEKFKGEMCLPLFGLKNPISLFSCLLCKNVLGFIILIFNALVQIGSALARTYL